MKTHTALQTILRNRYEEARTKNSAFSIRAFSKRVGISPATLSLVLNGKRAVSSKMIQKISDRLALDPRERAELFEKPVKPKTVPKQQNLIQYLRLSADQYQVIADATSFAFLNLLETKGFKNDSKWIAKRLKTSPKIIQETIERLLRLDMIKKDGSTYVRVKSRYRTTDDVASSSLKASHSQTLELAQKSLYEDAIEYRDFGWLTFPMSKSTISSAKELIRKFNDDLLELVENHGEADEVYRFSTQLFPLTQLDLETK
jgi:uncharacterized protein (TIGR02147 family)